MLIKGKRPLKIIDYPFAFEHAEAKVDYRHFFREQGQDRLRHNTFSFSKTGTFPFHQQIYTFVEYQQNIFLRSGNLNLVCGFKVREICHTHFLLFYLEIPNNIS
jgi:hypothetical protein